MLKAYLRQYEFFLWVDLAWATHLFDGVGDPVTDESFLKSLGYTALSLALWLGLLVGGGWATLRQPAASGAALAVVRGLGLRRSPPVVVVLLDEGELPGDQRPAPSARVDAQNQKAAARKLYRAAGAGEPQRGRTRRITSLPSPLSVVTRRSPPGARDRAGSGRTGAARGAPGPAGACRSASNVRKSDPLAFRHGDRQGAVEGAPLAVDEAAAGGREGRVAGAPAGVDLLAGQRLVGHRDPLVVAGHRVVAVVAAVDEPVDLVVAVGALLDRPQGAVARSARPCTLRWP